MRLFFWVVLHNYGIAGIPSHSEKERFGERECTSLKVVAASGDSIAKPIKCASLTVIDKTTGLIRGVHDTDEHGGFVEVFGNKGMNRMCR